MVQICPAIVGLGTIQPALPNETGGQSQERGCLELGSDKHLDQSNVLTIEHTITIIASCTTIGNIVIITSSPCKVKRPVGFQLSGTPSKI